MIPPRVWISVAIILLQLGLEVPAFVPQSDKASWKKSSPSLTSLVTKPTFSSASSKTSLNLFEFLRRNTNDDDKDDDDDQKKDEKVGGSNDDQPVQEKADSSSKVKEEKEEKQGRLPFFVKRFTEPKEQEEKSTKEEETVVASVAAVEETPAPAPTPPKPAPKPQLSPLEQAKALKAQADRMRLEAEKMDVILTLSKIEKLEKELEVAKTKGETTEELQNEMDALQAKIRGETPKVTAAPVAAAVATTKTRKLGLDDDGDDVSSSVDSIQTDKWGNFVSSGTRKKEIIDNVVVDDTSESSDFVGILSEMDGGVGEFNQKEFDERLKSFKSAPGFMKRTMANMVSLDFDTVDDINGTEVAVRFEKMERKDYSFLKDVPKPKFSPKMIQDMEQEIDSKPEAMFQEILRNKADGNTTALAIMLLEDFYYEEMVSKQFTKKNFGLDVEVDDRWKNIFEGGDDFTEEQRTAEALFPKCMRKEDQEGATLEQVQMLSTDVLPKASFNPSGKPEPVVGGFVVRGTNKEKNGDDLMEKIDAELAKNRIIGDKLSVFYVKDFTIYGDDSAEITETPPILYVTGADITPTRRRSLYTLITAFGLATAWYESIYPVLLNPDIMKRTEEQMSLAEANMAYDLSWLTDYAAPVFLSFLGIQLAHEAGHRAAAAVYGTNITLPTFVPSLVTGLTSSITTFKSPPKNNEAMFDFAIAGPLCGIIASLSALYFGLEMTVFTDAASYAKFPALPLQVLRQSSLGGGIVEGILGQGALSVPDAALGSQAIANINIPLHPLAIAGYIGLIINSLSLLPIGTTDGGRIALTLFGRGLKLVIGQVFLLLMFILGLSGSDLFLFYFSFIVFFQNGNEIPAKNEFDEISYARVLLATGMGVVTLLSLIPMS